MYFEVFIFLVLPAAVVGIEKRNGRAP